MEEINTTLNHRDALLCVILGCGDIEIQYVCELIEKHNLDIIKAVQKSRNSEQGLCFKSLVGCLLYEIYIKIFDEVRSEFDPYDESNLNAHEFQDWFIGYEINGTESCITIRDDAVDMGCPEEFVRKLTEKIEKI